MNIFEWKTMDVFINGVKVEPIPASEMEFTVVAPTADYPFKLKPAAMDAAVRAGKAPTTCELDEPV